MMRIGAFQMNEDLVLLHNIDILAVAAGYNRNEFLSKVNINPATYCYLLYRDRPFKKWAVKHIDQYIESLNDPWLSEIYKKAKDHNMNRYEIFHYDTKKLPDKSNRTILRTNLKGFRYFYYLDIRELSDMVGCSVDTIQSIETGRVVVSDKVCENVYRCLITYAYKKGGICKDIFNIGSTNPILPKIPRYFRI